MRSRLFKEQSEKNKEYIQMIVNSLQLTEEEFLFIFKYSKEDLDLLLNIKEETKLSDREEQLNDSLSTVRSAVRRLNGYSMPPNLILETLNHVYSFENNKVPPSSIIDLSKNRDFSVRWSLVDDLIEKVIYIYFRSSEIGDLAPYNKKVNRDIAVRLFNYEVDVKEKTIYEEHGGQYDIPEVQVKVYTYEDGSGDLWEPIKNYSEKIEDTWSIVSELAKRGVQFRLKNDAQGDKLWSCLLDDPDGKSAISNAQTPSLAICEATLKLLDKKITKDKI